MGDLQLFEKERNTKGILCRYLKSIFIFPEITFVDNLLNILTGQDEGKLNSRGNKHLII